MKLNFHNFERFETRHNGSGEAGIKHMLKATGAASLEELISQTIPASIRLQEDLKLPPAQSESEFLTGFKKLAEKNKIFRSYIGQGYYSNFVPSVILRNIMENPAWYTAYTPYQAEISQGRLEALVNFQTMVMDLTGMEIANASLLDEGTAAAEAMSMLAGLRKGAKKKAVRFFVDENAYIQTIDILKTRSVPVGIELVTGKVEELDLEDRNLYAVLLQYPDKWGAVADYKEFVKKAHEQGVMVAFAADLLSLTLLTPPGDMGADVVVGTTQRFGIPMGYGGPHAAFFATREEYKRMIPGRIIGISKDRDGNAAYRMALQTREQHIRREKATSNICTAQVLLAVMAGMYAVYHGPDGLRRIAERVHVLTRILAGRLQKAGYALKEQHYFDTLAVKVENPEALALIRKEALARELNLNYREGLGIVTLSLDETTRPEDIEDITAVFTAAAGKAVKYNFGEESSEVEVNWPESLRRKSAYLEHSVFHSYHIEHEMLRYIRHLESKDLSLVHSMISLGSCTMKLNASTEMIPLTWLEWSNIHPFVPSGQAAGYQAMFSDLEKWLGEITGFPGISLQPNSGAQGEYAGLLVIRAYHRSRGEEHRNIALIPSSAHGTNPASAVMAGMEVVIVRCDEYGNVDFGDLAAKAEKYRDRLSCLMITYPSTHGVFEEGIRAMADTIHRFGGQVYMDGANMNAQVGLTSPAIIGADVCHLNLHKTFCIPHGGGGPGMGPIGVAEHLKPFLPGSPVVEMAGGEAAISAVSAAPWGSASILTISYAYIALMGGQGLKKATQMAILNANYIKARLKGHYEVLYAGRNGRCAHEMIIDCRGFKKAGIEVEDIAKRLMDYGFHSPTVSFPVAGTMMIEPTESESVAELDRFCDALLSIRNEIRELEEGKADVENNLLKNAPHTAQVLLSEKWDKPYSREKAAYPLEFVRKAKFWPGASRIDSAYGDRNLICSCIPPEAYEEREIPAELQLVPE